jgi:hypothetical protein
VKQSYSFPSTNGIHQSLHHQQTIIAHATSDIISPLRITNNA